MLTPLTSTCLHCYRPVSVDEFVYILSHHRLSVSHNSAVRLSSGDSQVCCFLTRNFAKFANEQNSDHKLRINMFVQISSDVLAVVLSAFICETCFSGCSIKGKKPDETKKRLMTLGNASDGDGSRLVIKRSQISY